MEYKNLQEVMAAFLANKPRMIEGSEIDGWCGLDGVGYIADVPAEKMFVGPGNRHDAHQIVMDVTPDHIAVDVYYEDNTWQFYSNGILSRRS